VENLLPRVIAELPLSGRYLIMVHFKQRGWKWGWLGGFNLFDKVVGLPQ
jgi:hypothetical protein